jgi:hypothetical protein
VAEQGWYSEDWPGLTDAQRRHAFRLLDIAMQAALAAHSSFGRYEVLKAMQMVEHKLLEICASLDPEGLERTGLAYR